jgi:hypothetical protein
MHRIGLGVRVPGCLECGSVISARSRLSGEPQNAEQRISVSSASRWGEIETIRTNDKRTRYHALAFLP